MLFTPLAIAENLQAIQEPQVEVRVNWFPVESEANLIATYTFNTYSIDDLELLNAENWAFTKERIHPLGYDRCIKRIDKENNIRVKAPMDNLWSWQYYCHGNRHEFHDRWLCGTSDYYHPKIVNDPRFLTDWKRQVDQCVKLRKQWTTFYWRDHRKRLGKNRFIFIQPMYDWYREVNRQGIYNI